jgi:hypothetical protein
MEAMTERMRWCARPLAAAGMVLLALCAGAAAGSAEPGAHAARTLRLNESARLHLVHKSGPILSESGSATGTLPGSVSARFNTANAAKVTGTVTFHPHGGTLTVTVVGYPQSLGTVARVSGSLAVRRGTGRYARAIGGGRFTGTVNRHSWAISVHALANLSY